MFLRLIDLVLESEFSAEAGTQASPTTSSALPPSLHALLLFPLALRPLPLVLVRLLPGKCTPVDAAPCPRLSFLPPASSSRAFACMQVVANPEAVHLFFSVLREASPQLQVSCNPMPPDAPVAYLDPPLYDEHYCMFSTGSVCFHWQAAGITRRAGDGEGVGSSKWTKETPETARDGRCGKLGGQRKRLRVGERRRKGRVGGGRWERETGLSASPGVTFVCRLCGAQVWGLGVWSNLIAGSMANQSALQAAGMNDVLLDWLASPCASPQLQERIAGVLQSTAGHSISSRDLQKVLRLLRDSPRTAGLLLDTLQVVNAPMLPPPSLVPLPLASSPGPAPPPRPSSPWQVNLKRCLQSSSSTCRKGQGWRLTLSLRIAAAGNSEAPGPFVVLRLRGRSRRDRADDPPPLVLAGLQLCRLAEGRELRPQPRQDLLLLSAPLFWVR